MPFYKGEEIVLESKENWPKCDECGFNLPQFTQLPSALKRDVEYWLEHEDIAKAMYWRQSTKDILVHYINHRKYVIYDCLSLEESQIKKSFYLLKAQ